LTATKDSSFLFWQKWLFYTSLFFAVVGIAGALFGNNVIFQPYHTMLAKLFWHSSTFPPEAEKLRIFIYGPFGATMACCYILLAFIAHYPFKNKEPWARNAIITSFFIWGLIDSGVCLYYEVYLQVYLLNAFSIIIKALPIIFTWKHFSAQDTAEKS